MIYGFGVGWISGDSLRFAHFASSASHSSPQTLGPLPPPAGPAAEDNDYYVRKTNDADDSRVHSTFASRFQCYLLWRVPTYITDSFSRSAGQIVLLRDRTADLQFMRFLIIIGDSLGSLKLWAMNIFDDALSKPWPE